MKLEVGMYVRTKYGRIGKIIDLSKSIVFRPVTFKEELEEIQTEEISVMVDTNYDFDDENDSYLLEDIKKVEDEITDLIEVGDILEIKDIFGNISKVEVDENFELLTEKIISIITHEQIESMQYKVD